MVQFDPPLSSELAVVTQRALLPGSRLRLRAILSRDEHAILRRDGITVQVWSDFGTGEWSEASFAEEDRASVDTGATDFSLVVGNGSSGGGGGLRATAASPTSDDDDDDDAVTLVAEMSLSPLVGRTMQFTYRMLHASGVVSWLGNMGSNGSIAVKLGNGGAGLWSNDPRGGGDSDVFGGSSWTVPAGSEAVVAATLGRDAEWTGWAIGKEGPSRFIAVSSAVADRVALALLSTPTPNAYVVYAPVLFYTTGDATLSLTDAGDVVFRPGDKQAMLHASVSAETWRNAISEQATVLNLHSPHFMGVAYPTDASIRSVHFLPISGYPAPLTLKHADLNFPPEASYAMLDPATGMAKFFAAPLCDEVSVAVGPAGGHILAVSAYMLHRDGHNWIVSCLPRKTGRISAAGSHAKHASSADEVAPSKARDAVSDADDTKDWAGSKSEPAVSHPSDFLAFVLVLRILQFVLDLVSASVARALPLSHRVLNDNAPNLSIANDVLERDILSDSERFSSVAFEVTGMFGVFIKGDISQLALSLGEKPLRSEPRDLGGAWLFESDTGTDSHILEVSIQD